jgi:hypothetical protein
MFDYTMVVPPWGKSCSCRRCSKYRLLWPLQPFNLKVNFESFNYFYIVYEFNFSIIWFDPLILFQSLLFQLDKVLVLLLGLLLKYYSY